MKFPISVKVMIRAAGSLVVGLGLAVTTPAAGVEVPSGKTLGGPGYLVIEAARDSLAGFRWEAGPDPGQRSLVWGQGRLTLVDSLVAEDFGPDGLGIPFSARLAGKGASGQLLLRDGIYPVSEPVVITDGGLELRLSSGELEIRGSVIRYRRTLVAGSESRAGFLLLAGMTLLIIILLRRARLKAGQGTGT